MMTVSAASGTRGLRAPCAMENVPNAPTSADRHSPASVRSVRLSDVRPFPDDSEANPRRLDPLVQALPAKRETPTRYAPPTVSSHTTQTQHPRQHLAESPARSGPATRPSQSRTTTPGKWASVPPHRLPPAATHTQRTRGRGPQPLIAAEADIQPAAGHHLHYLPRLSAVGEEVRKHGFTRDHARALPCTISTDQHPHRTTRHPPPAVR
jgi:hypothetical protein